MEHIKGRCRSINHQGHFSASHAARDVVILMMDTHASIRANQTGKDAPMIPPEPAISLHDVGQRRQGWQSWECLTWWLIATSASLVWPLLIVVLLILLGDTANFLQALRNMHEKTLILVIAVIPFNKGILLGVVGRTQTYLHPNRHQEALQRGGKIPSAGASHPPWIMIKGHPRGAALLTQEPYHRLQSRCGMEIVMHLG